MSNTIKAAVSEFTLRFGVASASGRLLPVKAPSDAPKFKLCTPTGVKVKQQYVSVDDPNETYTQKECHRAVELEDGSYKYIGKDAVSDTKKSALPKNVLNLTAHRTEEVDGSLLPADGIAYIFEPDTDDPVNVQWHDFLSVIVRESGATFMGICNLNNNEGLFRLSTYNGHLMVEKHLYPEDLYEYEPVHPELDPATRTKALAVVAKNIQDFDANAYRNEATQRLIALAEGDHAPGEVIPKAEPVTIDLLAALDDFEI